MQHTLLDRMTGTVMDAHRALNSGEMIVSRRQVYRWVDWGVIPSRRQPQNPMSKRM